MMQARRTNHGAIWKLALGLIGAASLLLAQGQGTRKGQAAPAAAAAPAQPANVAKQPSVKSQKEAQELVAALNAPDTDSRIKAGEVFTTDFPASEFKGTVLYLIGASYLEKNDIENAVTYLERCVQADSQNFQALIMLARSISMRARETDLDREEKLTAAEKYANQATELLKTALKPNANLPDEQWEAAKKDMNSQVYEALGVAAFVRGKNDEAIAQLKKSIDIAAVPDPSTMVRLANVYSKAGKLDDGIAVVDKALAMPDLDARVKVIAQAQKDELVKKKGGAQAKP
jgi:tetratricopeptide (TPR) repeat protein